MGICQEYDHAVPRRHGDHGDGFVGSQGRDRMGCDESNPDEECLESNELPLPTVYLSPCYIDMCEVPNDQSTR